MCHLGGAVGLAGEAAAMTATSNTHAHARCTWHERTHKLPLATRSTIRRFAGAGLGLSDLWVGLGAPSAALHLPQPGMRPPANTQTHAVLHTHTHTHALFYTL